MAKKAKSIIHKRLDWCTWTACGREVQSDARCSEYWHPVTCKSCLRSKNAWLRKGK